MFLAPVIETTKDLVHIFGIPAIVIGLIKLGKLWQAFDARTKNTEKLAAETKVVVDTVATNHLAHMSKDLETQTTVLSNIDKNIAVLVDRTPRV